MGAEHENRCVCACAGWRAGSCLGSSSVPVFPLGEGKGVVPPAGTDDHYLKVQEGGLQDHRAVGWLLLAKRNRIMSWHSACQGWMWAFGPCPVQEGWRSFAKWRCVLNRVAHTLQHTCHSGGLTKCFNRYASIHCQQVDYYVCVVVRWVFCAWWQGVTWRCSIPALPTSKACCSYLQNGVVPIVEPEILVLIGDHDLAVPVHYREGESARAQTYTTRENLTGSLCSTILAQMQALSSSTFLLNPRERACESDCIPLTVSTQPFRQGT